MTEPPAGPRWLDDSQQKVWRAYLLASTLLQDRIDEDLRRQHGLSAVEYEILVRLSESDGQLRMAQLADSLAHSRSRVTHTVARMEDSGMVQRSESTVDRRGVVCRVTDRGMSVLRAAAPDHVETVRGALIDLATPADLAAFGRVMEAVCDTLVAGHPERETRP